MKEYINDSWYFKEVFEEADINNIDLSGFTKIRIPHTNKLLDYNYIDKNSYELISSYYTKINLNNYPNKLVYLKLLGSAHETTIYLNGKKALVHSCGYTSFRVLLNDFKDNDGIVNVLCKVDSRESLNIPPFGYVIDYLTYGGIYRDTLLEIKNPKYIEDVKAEGKDNGLLRLNIKYHGEVENLKIRINISNINEIYDANSSYELMVDAKPWSVDEPNLYELKLELLDNNEVVDTYTTNIGFRTITGRSDGIYLNGRKIKIRGLNRHQSYPYVGYAMPERVERRDARILKYELGLNAVRTSHYPQSEDFISECDRIGLLVFTEIPGWQHIGDSSWKEQTIQNTIDMINDLKNHPSIFMWGVRINESDDDHDFYTKTNEVARSLDSSRLIGGVRCIPYSELLEDVYTYNDFSHDGTNRGCARRIFITGNRKKPLLVTEYNGHMYPTKMFDDEAHRTNHLMRHYQVLEDVAEIKYHAGSFGWCMADYNTHKDFGSGDSICYHGVLDMNRCPKPAAYAYKSQADYEPVMEISSSFDIGEYPGGFMGDIVVMTNMDSVKLYSGDEFIKEFYPSKKYRHLAHPPIILDDLVGDRIINNEPKYSRLTANMVKKALISISKTGYNHLSLPTILRMGYLIIFRRITISEATRLYEDYIGAWGDNTKSYRLVGIKDGKEVITKAIEKYNELHFSFDIDEVNLVEAKSYDVSSVRVEALNQANNHLSYYNEALRLEASGSVEIIGPKLISFKGGFAGFYVKSIKKGKGKVLVYSNDLLIKEIDYLVK